MPAISCTLARIACSWKFFINHRSILFTLLLCLSLFLAATAAHAVTCAANMVSSNPDAAYTDNGDGTVTHVPTGLIWKRCSEGQTWAGGTCTGTASIYTWSSALIQARTSNFAAKTDWRLPNLKELRSLVEVCRGDPTINDTIFPNTPSWDFWSGSPFAADINFAWVVNFFVGGAYHDIGLRSNPSLPVRLVRGGQSFDSLAPQTLSTSVSGTGTGTVTSTPAGINCGATCSATFSGGTSVTLTATPASNSTFTGWSGACTGTGSCTVTMSAAQNVTATFTLPIPAAITAAERTVLVNLYNSTNGASWTNNSGWLGAPGTECTWYGVSCVADVTDPNVLHVNVLALENNNLNGTIPSLDALTNLTIFYVHSNQLTGQIPSLSVLKNLSHFEVSINQLTGQIPSLSGLTNLTIFYVHSNQLTGQVPSLIGLSNLTHFVASTNQLTGQIPSLSGLTNLTNFIVFSNQLTGSAPTAPTSLTAGGSNLCGNHLQSTGNAASDAAWNVANGSDFLACQTNSPNAPTIGNATALNASANVVFTAPANTGGIVIDQYRATCTNATGTSKGTATSTTSPIVVGSLTNGTSYTCTVAAHNSLGWSAESAPSNSFVPATVPNAPKIGTAKPGNASASIAFTAPAITGGAKIDQYRATCGTATNTGTTSPIVVSGLNNGTSYTCTVAAQNSAGWSAESAPSNAVVPVTVPDTPTLDAATPGNTSINVAFTAPSNNGGAAISQYRATCGTVAKTGATSPIVVSGLTNGTSYTCTVAAQNSVGWSAESAASNPVVPTTVPDAPTIGAVTAGNASASVAFAAPTNAGGVKIDQYRATCGTVTKTGATSPIVVSGLTNGTSYTCTVAAQNSVGWSKESGASKAVVPATVPDAPTIGAVTAGNASANVAFAAPANTGGMKIDQYRATCGTVAKTGATSPIVVSGLTNGTSYTCTVEAQNSAGWSAKSAPSAPVVPATVPVAPTIGTVTPGNASINVAFTAPTNTGGIKIDQFRATCGTAPGTKEGTGTTSPIVVSGLTNGTSYTCTVAVQNSAGWSKESGASKPVVPVTVPDAPTMETATPGNASVSVAFSAPTNTGGAKISQYRATCGTVAKTGATSPIVVSGLTNGTNYTCTVAAQNSAGWSAESASKAVVPVTVPDAPTIGTASSGNASINVAFTAPTNTGGVKIDQYRATCGTAGVTKTGTGTTSPVVVSGLTNGTSYTCTVAAQNSAGWSKESTASKAVVPANVPDAPTIGAVTAGNASISVTFTAPTNTGGLKIDQYRATCNTGTGTGTGTKTGTGATSPIVVSGLTNGTS